MTDREKKQGQIQRAGGEFHLARSEHESVMADGVSGSALTWLVHCVLMPKKEEYPPLAVMLSQRVGGTGIEIRPVEVRP